MLDVFDRLVSLSQGEQQDLALRMAVLTHPYGVVAPHVVEPALFLKLSRRLAEVALGRQDASRVLQRCQAVFARFDQEEPTDSGFFAFGALVMIAYAAQALSSAPSEGVENCARRFLDLLDAADDDGAEGLCDSGIEWLRQPTPVLEESLRRSVASHAEGLTVD